MTTTTNNPASLPQTIASATGGGKRSNLSFERSVEEVSKRCFPLILALGMAALVLPAAFGQTPASPGRGDSSSSNSNTKADPCAQTYSQDMAKAEAHMSRITAQWHRDLIDCRGDAACEEQARQRRQAGERDVYKEGVDAGGKRDICEEQRRLANGRPNPDTCQQTYSQDVEKTAEHMSRITAQWHRDLIDCRGDAACEEQARQRRHAGERDVYKEGVDAGEKRDICEEQRRLERRAGGAEGTTGNGTGEGLKLGDITLPIRIGPIPPDVTLALNGIEKLILKGITPSLSPLDATDVGRHAFMGLAPDLLNQLTAQYNEANVAKNNLTTKRQTQKGTLSPDDLKKLNDLTEKMTLLRATLVQFRILYTKVYADLGAARGLYKSPAQMNFPF